MGNTPNITKAPSLQGVRREGKQLKKLEWEGKGITMCVGFFITDCIAISLGRFVENEIKVHIFEFKIAQLKNKVKIVKILSFGHAKFRSNLLTFHTYNPCLKQLR